MAFVVWGLLAACAVYWAIQGLAHPMHVAAPAVAERSAPEADLSRLFGARPASVAVAQPAIESRFKLLGVVAPKQAGQDAPQGLALIAVDGVPRTVRVGAVVDGDWRLVSVDRRSARISQGQGADPTGDVTLQLAAAQPTTPSNMVAPMAPAMQAVTPLPMPQQPAEIQPAQQVMPQPMQQPGTRPER